jgi:hypothetical protein
MADDERERRKGVYVTLKSVGHDKKATERLMLLIRKWMDQNLSGTQEGKTMRRKNNFPSKGRIDGTENRNELQKTL